jgi:3-oxoacyl-[acyl-carrier protein] reductase
MGELDYTGRTVLVVGGSSGIGNGIARRFLSRGANVHVTGTKATAAGYDRVDGSDLQGLGYAQLDVTDPDNIEHFAHPFDRLDVLVLSQGLVRYKRAEFERDGWDKVLAVNLDSVMHCARHFKPMLASSRGSLIVISSIMAFRSSVGNPAYAASKAGAASLTMTLGESWAADGVRVNGIAPGIVETKLTTATTAHPDRRDATLAAIPLRRFGTPADIAGVALFLASPLAAYIVGQTITVDGGMLLS